MSTLCSSVRCFNGVQNVYQHFSITLKCDMKYGVYIPDLNDGERVPTLFYLSGLTCTHSNFMEKSGMQKYASEKRMIVIHPDTSPRGVDIPGDADHWDFGKGAGFYVDSTQEPWRQHYNMYSYISSELLKICSENLPVNKEKIGIFGHSMGGHGAIVLGLRNPAVFKSISAFAPICNPMSCAWGKKAFSAYLGTDEKHWCQYDSSELIKEYDGKKRKILIHQGLADQFLTDGQLRPETLVSTDKITIELKNEEGYDHGYYFISTFLSDHFEHHAEQLGCL